jgi:hypothetical protein
MFRSLLLKLGMGVLGREIRAAAEGKHGAAAQRVYLALQGRKTLLGLLLGAVCAGLVSVGYAGPEAWIAGTIGGLLTGVGLIDKSWRGGPLLPMGDYAIVRFARDHALDIAAVFSAGYAALGSCDVWTASFVARLGLTCTSATVLLSGIAGALAWLLGEARLAPPPIVRKVIGALLLALLLPLTAYAQAPAPSPTAKPVAASVAAERSGEAMLDVSGWTLAVLTRGEKREYVGGRVTLDLPVGKGVRAFARGDITGTQDFKSVEDFAEYQTFRSVEGYMGLRYPIGAGGLAVGALVGTSWSIEGEDGPLSPHMATALGVVRLPLPGDGYAYLGAGHRGPVGGAALVASVTYPTGPTRLLVDYDYPLERAPSGELQPWVLKLGVAVPLKRWAIR